MIQKFVKLVTKSDPDLFKCLLIVIAEDRLTKVNQRPPFA